MLHKALFPDTDDAQYESPLQSLQHTTTSHIPLSHE